MVRSRSISLKLPAATSLYANIGLGSRADWAAAADARAMELLERARNAAATLSEEGLLTDAVESLLDTEHLGAS